MSPGESSSTSRCFHSPAAPSLTKFLSPVPTEAVQRPKPKSYNLQLLCGHGADRPMDNTDRASSVPVGALWAFFFALSLHWLSPSGFAKQISLWCGGGGGVGHLLICQVNSLGSRGRRAGHPSPPGPANLLVRFGGYPAPRHPLAAQRLLLAPFSVRSTSR